MQFLMSITLKLIICKILDVLNGVTSQIRRAALSISANLAESFGRNHTADKINFLYFTRPVKYFSMKIF